MKNKLHKGIREWRQTGMTATEEALVRSRVFAYIDQTVIPEMTWQAQCINMLKSIYSRPRFAYATFALALVLFFGTTITYAAGTSLPGDTLYPVKIYFAEPMRTVFTFTDYKRVQWEATKAERRVVEVEALIAQNRLNDTTREDSEERFKSYALQFDGLLSRIEQSGSTEETLDTRASFEARLRAHSQIMDVLEQHTDPVQKKEAVQFRRAVKVESDRISETRKKLETTRYMNREKTPLKQTVDRQKIKNKERIIESRIKETGQKLDYISVPLTPIQKEVVERVEKTLDTARQTLEEASREKNTQSVDQDTYAKLRESEGAALEADVSLREGLKLKKYQFNEKDSRTRGGASLDTHNNTGTQINVKAGGGKDKKGRE